MKNSRKSSVKIALKEINVVNFSIVKTTPNLLKLNYNNIGHGIGLAHKLSLKNNLFFIKVNVDILLRKSTRDKNPKTLGNLTTEFIFKVKNLRNLVKKDKDGKIGIPQELFDTFNNISLSTSRGILHCKLSNSFLHKLVMPIINPKSLIKKNGK